MKKIVASLFCLLMAACTYVPPEAISPVVEACQKYGMNVQVTDEYIWCWKKKD